MKATTQVNAIHISAYIERYAENDDKMRTAELWVANTMPASERGAHHFNVSPINGGRGSLVVIPSTFIPVRLDTQAPIAHLIENTSFKSALSRRSIAILDTADVYKYFAENERARTEYERINGYPWDAGSRSVDLAATKETIYQPDAGAPDDTLGELVANLLVLAETDTPDAVVSAIINSSDELNADQLQHIADNVADSEIRNICMELIADKKAD